MHTSMPRNNRSITLSQSLRALWWTLCAVCMIATFAAALPGCTALGSPTGANTIVPTATVNDQAALAYDAVTYASTTINTLYRAGKMTLTDHRAWQAKLTTTYVAIGTATTIAQLQQLQKDANAVATANGAPPK